MSSIRLLAALALALLAAVVYSRATARPAEAAPADPALLATEFEAYTLGPGRTGTFWWVHQGEVSNAAVWFGPVESLPSGARVRRWVGFASLPGSARPLGAFHSAVRLDSSESIGLGADSFSVRLDPPEGLLWGDVSDSRDLLAAVEGLF